jgi:multimeric flavodoxin WrbA
MFLVISASPNSDGLTAACVKAALAGFRESGAEAKHLDLCEKNLKHCRQCENSWGRCRREHSCIIEDDLPLLQQHLAAADGLVIVTPVYYGEPAESMKAALDRLRRCEATRGDACALANKPVISVAAAGGSGGGTITCLLSLENWTRHMRGQVADLIAITQRSRGYKLATIQAATAELGKLVV